MSPERKRLVVSATLAVAATAAVVLLIGKAAHYANLLTHLRDAQPGWLLLCAAGEALAYAGFIASYQAMAELDGGPKLTYSTVARIVGLSFGAFSVATAIGGLSVDFWALREAGEPPRLAGARIIALETMRWAMLTLATCCRGDHRPGRGQRQSRSLGSPGGVVGHHAGVLRRRSVDQRAPATRALHEILG